MTEDEAVRLIGAVLAWYDTEAAFGADDARTLAAADRMRHCIREVTRESEQDDWLNLTVIRGDLE